MGYSGFRVLGFWAVGSERVRSFGGPHGCIIILSLPLVALSALHPTLDSILLRPRVKRRQTT